MKLMELFWELLIKSNMKFYGIIKNFSCFANSLAQETSFASHPPSLIIPSW